jgi:hypothetical protein
MLREPINMTSLQSRPVLLLRGRIALSSLVAVIAVVVVVGVAGLGYYLAVGNGRASSSTGFSNANTITIADQAGCGSIGGSWSRNDSTPAGHFICARITPLVIPQGETVIFARSVQVVLYDNVTNYGTIINKSCCLTNHSGWLDVQGNYFYNHGTIMNYGDFFSDLGVVEFHNYGTIVVLHGSLFIIHMETRGIFFNEATGSVVNHGTIVVPPFRSPTLKNAGNLTNSSDGVLEFDDSTTFVNSATVTNFGFISTSGAVMNSGAIEDECGGTFYRATGSVYSGNSVNQACASTTTTA